MHVCGETKQSSSSHWKVSPMPNCGVLETFSSAMASVKDSAVKEPGFCCCHRCGSDGSVGACHKGEEEKGLRMPCTNKASARFFDCIVL